MLCERCGINNAEVHLVKIVNGERYDEHVCRECAKNILPFEDAAKMMKMTFSLEGIMDVQEALKDLIFPALSELPDDTEETLKCPHCGGPLLKEMFYEPDADAQVKEPAEPISGFDTDELTSLKKEMELTVKDERYERAAELRDRIRELEKSNGEEKGA